MHPSVSLMLNNPRMRSAIERALAARGTHGDTMIAHISPAEALRLRAMGGVGTRNPRTGLPQFYGDDVGGPSTSDAPGGGPAVGAGSANRAGSIGSSGRDGSPGIYPQDIAWAWPRR